MSKPWFLQMTMEAEPSSLAKQIKSILGPLKSHLVEETTLAIPITNGTTLG